MLIILTFGILLLSILLLFGALKESDTPRKVPVVVTESAANTFTAAVQQLPNARGDTVFDLDKVELRMPTVNTAAVADFGEYRVQLQKDTGSTPTALLASSDRNLIYEAVVRIGSSVEADDIIMFEVLEMGEDHVGYAEYIANDSVFLCVEGSALASAAVVRGRLIGSVEKLTDKQIGALLLAEID